MSTTNYPITDSEIAFSGAYTCTHHNDAMRAACPVCLVAALTAERDQLRFENSNLRAGQKACEACDEPTAFEVRQLRARAERAEAELADQAARFHDEIVSRQGTVRANKKLDLEERDQLRAELATAQAQAKLWEDKCHELIAPHYILDPCLRAHKFREALQYHPVLPTPFWKKYGGPNDT